MEERQARSEQCNSSDLRATFFCVSDELLRRAASGDKMAVQLDGGGKEELKTQFVTREGTYKLMTLSEYSRPNRVGYTNGQGSASVRVSFVTLPDPADPTGAQGLGDRMCFNFGKELYVYVYRGVKKVSPTMPSQRRRMMTRPTCPDDVIADLLRDLTSQTLPRCESPSLRLTRHHALHEDVVSSPR